MPLFSFKSSSQQRGRPSASDVKPEAVPVRDAESAELPMAPKADLAQAVEAAIMKLGPDEKTPLMGAFGVPDKLSRHDATPFPMLNNLIDQFGYKLLILLFASQHLMKGFATAFIGPCTQFLFGSYKVAGPQMQIFGGVVGLPWAMKPVIGLLSDLFPIMGYHKAPYIIIASLAGALACCTIATVPHDGISIESIVLCLFLLQLQFSTCDLLTEAKYAEKMQNSPQHGPALLSYVWFGLQCGGLLATAMIGPIMKYFGFTFPFKIVLFPVMFIIVPVALGYLEEKKRSPEEAVANRAELMKQAEACFLCVLMFISTIILSVLGIWLQSPLVNAVAAITVAVIMLIAFSVVLQPTIAKVNAFFLIQTSFGISIGGASFYFFTDGPKQYPDGPHFSMEFYTSVLGVAGSICSLIGIYTYQKYASKWTYRGLLLTANLALCVLSCSDLVLFTRFNKKLGIGDHYFVLGASVLQSVVAQWMWMPGVVILSQLCPKGMEATMYALLAGCHNLGNTIASNVGALVLQNLGCQPSGSDDEGDQFQYLWVGSLMSIVMPLMTLALLPYLIPDASQTDKLLAEDAQDATKGSLWRRWTGKDE